jgi:hypothetical protein
MPADLVSREQIPELANRVTPKLLNVLRQIQKSGYIKNDQGIDRETADILGQLVELGLVDPGYEGDTNGSPNLWISNGNGSRVLGYWTGIRAGPHYEVSALQLAAWLDDQGKECWWNVDGDPLLTGRMTFPCQAAALARELRMINRPLLIQAKQDDSGAKGQIIGKEKLTELVSHFYESVRVTEIGEMPHWGNDRLLYLCWKGSFQDWLLEEDSETTKQNEADETATAN